MTGNGIKHKIFDCEHCGSDSWYVLYNQKDSSHPIYYHFDVCFYAFVSFFCIQIHTLYLFCPIVFDLFVYRQSCGWWFPLPSLFWTISIIAGAITHTLAVLGYHTYIQVWSQEGSTFKKKMTLNSHFSRLAQTDSYTVSLIFIIDTRQHIYFLGNHYD